MYRVLQLQNIPVAPQRSPCPFVVTPWSLPQSQATTNLFPVSYRLAFLDISYKVNPTICLLWCLAPSTWRHVMSLRFIHLQPVSVVCSFPCRIFRSMGNATFRLPFTLMSTWVTSTWGIKLLWTLCVFRGTYAFIYLGQIHRVGLSESCCKFMFHFLRNGQIVCQSGCRCTLKEKKWKR